MKEKIKILTDLGFVPMVEGEGCCDVGVRS